MKFERLSNNELRSLEKEFIQFLVVNGIVAADWEKSKKKMLKKQKNSSNYLVIRSGRNL